MDVAGEGKGVREKGSDLDVILGAVECSNVRVVETTEATELMHHESSW